MDELIRSLRERLGGSRRHDSGIEAGLRRARPQAPDELVARLVAATEVASGRRRGAPHRLATAAALTLVFLVAAGSLGGIGHAAVATRKAVAAVTTAVSPRPADVTICDATGSRTNPYVARTVSSNGLGGHGSHSGDLVPAPRGGCPAPQAAAPASSSSSSASNKGGKSKDHDDDDDDDDSSDDDSSDDDPGEDQYKPGKGCGDKNHVHFKQGKCKDKHDN